MRKSHGEVKSIDGRRVPTPEYRAWQSLKNRCYNVNSADYPYYGGRGITVCVAWVEDFPQFLKDMGRRPSSSHTLDRKNGDKGYSKSNCRWATRQVQARNRKYATTRLWELCEKLGVTRNTATHYLWTLRRKLSGNPTRYTISAEAEAIIIKHMGESL